MTLKQIKEIIHICDRILYKMDLTQEIIATKKHIIWIEKDMKNWPKWERVIAKELLVALKHDLKKMKGGK